MPNAQRQYQHTQAFLSEIKHRNFLDDEIIKKAEKIGEELSGVSITKMRQYFDDIKGLRRRIQSGLTDQQVKTRLRLIQSRVAYDVGRAPRNKEQCWKNFREFLKGCIDKIMGLSDIKQPTDDFITFMEAVYGYFYCEARQKQKEE